MKIRSLKKEIVMLTSTMMVITSLVVGSYAWYKMSNGGNLVIDIPTNEGDAIAFTFSSYDDVDGTLSPAKMKQGVINNCFDRDHYLSGKYDILNIPKGTGVLAKTNEVYSSTGKYVYDTYELDEDTKNLKPKGDYLTTPGTQIYRQFALRLGSANEDAKRTVVFDMDVDYYDAFIHENNDDKHHKLEQKDALSFGFYVFDSDVDSTTLSNLSTSLNQDASKKKTISEMFYDPNGYGRYEKVKSNEIERGVSYYTINQITSPSDDFVKTYYEYFEDSKVYHITDDKKVDASKNYYQFTEVSSPTAADLGTYYEKTINKLYSFEETSTGYTLNRLRNAETWDQDHAKDYILIPQTDKNAENFKMTLYLDGLEFNKTYYIMTSVYYNVPDELLEGDLWLANKIDINIGYSFLDS